MARKITPIDPSKKNLIMMDPAEARRRAAKIPVMKPGVVVSMRLEVALMWLKENNMRGVWRGDLFVVHKIPSIKQGES